MNTIVARKPRIVTITAQKGGVLKSTTATILATALASNGYRVLLADFDPQGHCSVALGVPKQPGLYNLFDTDFTGPIFQDSERDNLTLLPGTQKTKTLVAMMLSGELPREHVIDKLRTVGSDYDYLLFDTPASGPFQEVAIRMSDQVIVCAQPSKLSLDGVGTAVKTARMINPGSDVIILPSLCNLRAKSDQRHMATLAADYGSMVAMSIPTCAAVKGAQDEGKTIWEHKEPSGNRAYIAVRLAYKELVKRVEGGAR